MALKKQNFDLIITDEALRKILSYRKISNNHAENLQKCINALSTKGVQSQLIKVKGANRPLWCHSVDNEHVLYFTIGKGQNKKEIRILEFCTDVSNNLDAINEMLLSAGEFENRELLKNSCIEEFESSDIFPLAPDIRIANLKHGLKTYLNPKTDDELDQVIATDEKMTCADELQWCKFRRLEDWRNPEDLSLRLGPKQERMIHKPRPLLLQGVAGSGKTTILVHMAHQYAQANQGKKKTLIVVYTNPLKSYVLSLLEGIFASGKKDESIDVYTWRELCDYLSEKVSKKKLNWIDEIERIYLHLKWHRKELNLSDKLSITDLLEIIRAVIKGRSVHQELIPFEDFKIMNLNEVSYNNYFERDMIYAAAECYQNYLDSNQYIDDMDAARYLMNKADKLPRWDLVLIDETQDYTLVQLRLMTALSWKPSGLVFLGDEHQVVYPSLFSWDRIKEAIFDVWNFHPPEIEYLNFNYRNPRPVSEMGNIIMSYRLNQLNNQRQDVYSNHSLTPKPIRIQVFKKKISDIIKLLANNIGSLGIIFHSQASTQIKQAQNLKFQGIGFRRAFLPQSVKGIEFDVVCLINFNIEYRNIVFPGKTELSNSCFLLMLNEVYVSLTRTRGQLIIVDATSRQKGLWDEVNIKKHITIVESEDRILEMIPSSYQVKNSAGWCSAAIDFEHQNVLSSAAECWERADEHEKAAFCYESIKNYKKAAKSFTKAENFIAAAESYVRINMFYDAALSYEKVNQFNKAANCYEKANHFEIAAKIWNKIGKSEKVAECYEKINNYKLAAQTWEKIGKFEKVAKCYEKTNNLKSAAQVWCKIGEFEKAANCYERTNSFKLAAQAWFRINNTRKAISCIEQIKHFSKKVAVLLNNNKLFKEEAIYWENLAKLSKHDINQMKEYFVHAAYAWKNAGILPNLSKTFRNSLQSENTSFNHIMYFYYSNKYDELLLNKKVYQAEQTWKEIKKINIFKDMHLFFRAGVFFEKIQKWILAAENFEKSYGHQKAGECYEKLSLWVKAAINYEKAELWSKAADNYKKAKLWVKAAGNYEKAELWSKAAFSYKKVKLWDKVADIAERAELWDEAAHSYERAELLDKAVENYERAELWNEAAYSYIKAQLWDKAAENYERAKLWDKAAYSYKKAKLWDKAAENYERARLWDKAAENYEKAELLDKAAENYEKAELWDKVLECSLKSQMYET